MVAEIVVYWRGQPNQFAPAVVGCPVCSTSQGQPQPGAIFGAAEK